MKLDENILRTAAQLIHLISTLEEEVENDYLLYYELKMMSEDHHVGTIEQDELGRYVFVPNLDYFSEEEVEQQEFDTKGFWSGHLKEESYLDQMVSPSASLSKTYAEYVADNYGRDLLEESRDAHS